MTIRNTSYPRHMMGGGGDDQEHLLSASYDADKRFLTSGSCADDPDHSVIKAPQGSRPHGLERGGKRAMAVRVAERSAGGGASLSDPAGSGLLGVLASTRVMKDTSAKPP